MLRLAVHPAVHSAVRLAVHDATITPSDRVHRPFVAAATSRGTV